jgi:Lrp/AsnC family transcriptional regulator, leucine-responsive regulatory protein
MDRIDDIDARILTLLQEDGRAKRNRIAEAVGLSLPAVSERMRKLEERGIITAYTVRLDARRLGFDVTAFIRVVIAGSEYYDAFIRAVTRMPEVLEIHSVTGEGSHLLKVRVRNTGALEQLLAALQRQSGVRGTQTSIVLSSIKESSAVPVEPIAQSANGA